MDYLVEILLVLIPVIPTILATIASIKKDNKKNSEAVQESVKQIGASVQELSTKLDNHLSTSAMEKADNRRLRILRFSDEISEGQLHSEEHFDNILEDIDLYEAYCREHPEYPNTKCLMAIENVKNSYRKRLQKNDFLK